MSQTSNTEEVEIHESAPKKTECVVPEIYENKTIKLIVDGFGTHKNPITNEIEIVKRYTWTNKNKMSVQVITYGATIVSMKVPDKFGFTEDVVLGYDNMDGYMEKRNPYFGATVGRVCNRIANGEFYLDCVKYNVAKNWNNLHHLHGGIIGFDKANWIPYVEGTTVIMTHISGDEDEGYPGSVMTRVTFKLSHNNNFSINYVATTSKPTPINLTNHSYFNLGGHGSGHKEIYKHIISINADKYTDTDHESIPTGRLNCVGGTIYDLRIPHELGPALSRTPNGGYDDNFCVTQGTEQTLTFIARALHPESGRVLEIYSDQPGVQFYTSNFLPDPDNNIAPTEVYTQDYYDVSPTTAHSHDSVNQPNISQMVCKTPTSTSTNTSLECKEREIPIIGKKGAQYLKHGAFCLETQKYPDSVNHKNFPNVILRPGDIYKHEIIYKFSTHMGINQIRDVEDEIHETEEEEEGTIVEE